MSIFKGSTRLKVYKGDYKPANFYLGNIKKSGWKFETKTGQSLNFLDTYKDSYSSILIKGKNIQSSTVVGTNLLNPLGRRTIFVAGYGTFVGWDLSEILTVGQTYTLSTSQNAFLKINVAYGAANADGLIGLVATSKTFTWRTRADGKREYLFISQGVSPYNPILDADLVNNYNPMLAAGSTTQSYVAYVQPSPNPLLQQAITYPQNFNITNADINGVINTINITNPLYGIPDGSSWVARNYYELVNGRIYELIEAGKVVLNGTENWNIYTTQGTRPNGCLCFNVDISNSDINAKMLCSHFKYDANAHTSKPSGWFSTAGATIKYFTIQDTIITQNTADTDATKITKFKTWLGSNNVTVYYKLATPTVTDITSTALGQALLNLETFKQNTILAVNNSLVDLEATLKTLDY